MSNEVAVLGVGMHPWGKWGRNFVEYGIVAARAALADAGVDYRDVQFISGADTVRNGYPGYVAGATFAQALGWTGASRLRMLPWVVYNQARPLVGPRSILGLSRSAQYFLNEPELAAPYRVANWVARVRRSAAPAPKSQT